LSINAQQSEETQEIYSDPNIKTILFYQSGWDLSMPVIFINENQKLSLDFDDLEASEVDFSYSVTSCTFDWKINDVSEHEYLEGINDIPIYNVRQSINTTKSYTHYSATLPNEDIQLSKSGNYLLRVYKNEEPDKIIFTKRFCIAERLADVKAYIKKPDDENQEIFLEIDLGNLDLSNPLAEIKVVVIKNYDWNNQIEIITSPFLRDNKLFFDMPFQIMSPGGNEFRFFDIKSTKFISERVNNIEYLSPCFHFYLKPDELKRFKPYFTLKDLNGRFYIDIPDVFNRHEEADYVYVHFTLETTYPFGSDVYIYGALTNYKTDESNYMTFNIDKQAYEKTLLLKQGYYNYAYVLKDYNEKKIEFDPTEGTHAETENDYIVFVYLKKTISDIDRLVGYKIINSTEPVK
jgi:hypothetical protein